MVEITPHTIEVALVRLLLFGAVAFCVMAILANWRRDEDMACKKGKKKGKK